MREVFNVNPHQQTFQTHKLQEISTTEAMDRFHHAPPPPRGNTRLSLPLPGTLAKINSG